MGKHSAGVAKGSAAQQKAQAAKNETKVAKAVVARGNTQQSS